MTRGNVGDGRRGNSFQLCYLLYCMRYAKQRRPNALPSINTPYLHQLLQQQQSLMAEVEHLDRILKAEHLTTINGFIFTTEIKNRLPDDITECVTKQHRLIAYGLEFERIDAYETKSVKKEIVHAKPTFIEKLKEMSIKSVEKYDSEKLKQLEKLQESRWKVPSTTQSKVSTAKKLKTETPHTQQITEELRTRAKPAHHYHTAKKMTTQNREEDPQVGPEDIEKILKKLPIVVSIWLPPKTYPQFYGILVPSLTQTSSQTKCRIKKYIFFKQGLSERFFSAILDYLSAIFCREIESMEMIMTKVNYLLYFKCCGWKMKSWEGVDRINAIFTKLE